MKHVILVDMENMHRAGYEGLENLNSSFDIVFFESPFTPQIPKACLALLDQKDINYSFEWCERNRLNKDTMDFCMIAYLALRSSLVKTQASQETYYVLSKDSDFEIPSSYIKDKVGIEINLAQTIDQILTDHNLEKRQLTPEQIIQLCLQQATSKHHLHCLLQKTLKCFYPSPKIGGIYRHYVGSLKSQPHNTSSTPLSL